MVHVANAEGHRKMLAFQEPPAALQSTTQQPPPTSSSTTTTNKNLSHILIDTISKKFGPISSTEVEKVSSDDLSSASSGPSTVILLQNNQQTVILPTYKSNSLNLSCIIEEEPPPSMMNSTIREASSGISQDPNANCDIMTSDDPNLNSTTTTTTRVMSSGSPGTGERLVMESVTTTTTTKVSMKRSAGSPCTTTLSLEKVIQSHLADSSSPSSPTMEGAAPEQCVRNPNPSQVDCESGGERSDICFHSSVVGPEAENDDGPRNENDSIYRKSFTSIPTNFRSNTSGENEKEGESTTSTTGGDVLSSPSNTSPVGPLPSVTTVSSIHGRQGKPTNGIKHVSLKRVSFGSSKGSMVETVIFESPQPDERSEVTTPSGTPAPNLATKEHPTLDSPSTGPGSTGGSRPPSRVRVTFFESEKPLAVGSPDSADPFDLDLSNMTQPSPVDTSTPNNYSRHLSVESGWENPFRPDGDLSKEADQIVELIKEGKPINDETLRSISPSVSINENDVMRSTNYTNNLMASPPPQPQAQPGKGTNGAAAASNGTEVQRGVVVPPSQTGTVEHVTLKKKKGCCVIQ